MDFRQRKSIVYHCGVAFMKIVLAAMCVGRKNRGGDEIYGESIYTKAECRKLPTFSGKTDAVLFRKRTFSRQLARSKRLVLQLTWDKK
jgi:threonine aldolase